MPGGVHPPWKVIYSWPIPNYKNPEERGHATTIVSSVLGAFMLFVVATRLIARACVQRNFGIDDWIMLLAMIPTVALTVGMVLAVERYGFNRHVWDVPLDGYIPARKIYFANDIFYILSSGLIKVSILLFYKRMSAGTFSRKFLYVVWACIAFVVAYMIAFLLIVIFGCRPISAFWWSVDFRVHRPYTCINEPKSVIAATSISLIQDFIAASLPMALFATLQIPKRQRIALGAVFAFGYFLCAANGARMYYIYRTFYETYDTTWTAYNIWLWTAVEILLAPVCASAPALKVYFRGILKDRSWSTWQSLRRSGSRRWRRTGSGDDAEGELQSTTMQSSDWNGYRQSSLKKTGADSPILGERSSMQMDYLNSGRNSGMSMSDRQYGFQVQSSSPRPNLSKAEKTLGLGL